MGVSPGLLPELGGKQVKRGCGRGSLTFLIDKRFENNLRRLKHQPHWAILYIATSSKVHQLNHSTGPEFPYKLFYIKCVIGSSQSNIQMFE